MYCDGSLADDICGGAYVAYGSNNPGPRDDDWTLLAWSCFRVEGKSITAGELEAAAGAMSFAIAYICNPDSWQNSLDNWLPQAYINTEL